MENVANQHFIEALNDLKQKQVHYDYPNELAALTAIRATLRSKVSSSIPPKEKTDKVETKPQIKPTIDVKAEPTKPDLEPELQNDTSKNEGNI